MRANRVTAVVLAVALTLGACSSGGDGDRGGSGDDRSSSATPILIDTDVGADDVTAILYLLQHPDVRVEAITVSGTGLAHCDGGVRTVLGLLEIAGRSDVPVACGRETPLGGSNAFPDDWRSEADRAYGLALPESPRVADGAGAPALLTDALRGSAAPITLVTLGPLTNVAEALAAEPTLAQELVGIVSMGGALLAAGNVEANPEAEWNFHADPRAVDVVLRSRAPITLVPLDATNAVPVTEYFFEALAAHHVTPEADTILALLERNPWMVEGEYFWDPLAATVAVGAATATVEEQRVIVLEGSPDVDGELVISSKGVDVRVAMDADPLAFEAELINTLNGDQAISSTRPEPDLSVTLTTDGCTSDVPPSLPAGSIDVEVSNPLPVAGAVVLTTTSRGHSIDELVAFVESLDPTKEARPPKWLEVEGWIDAPPGGSLLTPWQLVPGDHAVVCGLEREAAMVAGTTNVTG
jgi:inosine-uridine nucleoside N-ribohydrolase